MGEALGPLEQCDRVRQRHLDPEVDLHGPTPAGHTPREQEACHPAIREGIHLLASDGTG